MEGRWGTCVQGQGELRVAPVGIQRGGSRRRPSAAQTAHQIFGRGQPCGSCLLSVFLLQHFESALIDDPKEKMLSILSSAVTKMERLSESCSYCDPKMFSKPAQ